ncbi:NUDIX hydrolase [Saccharibacillus sp. JS10]|uniref:NUDIX hydrolase n=1 Tax=Saccharibacillus sp. JS10 TaxID=2950552 RepID=UPI002108E554|nr:NUDIX domain-containing protein [Saccharibacillus sp. JS10]MCQ4088426.1 NUDIX domain-containing protein [Saccharibacillus sp. JS10]
MMISFDIDSSKFNFRAACIVIQNNKILFQQAEGEDYWFLPGGRVELHEDTTETLSRELKEEFGFEVSGHQLVWIVENFFELEGKKFHEIGFYYRVTIQSVDEEKEEIGIEPGYRNRWIDLKELDQHKIVPSFIKDELLKMSVEDQGVKHFIHRD